jgi:hypothetical protein
MTSDYFRATIANLADSKRKLAEYRAQSAHWHQRFVETGDTRFRDASEGIAEAADVHARSVELFEAELCQ